MKSGAGGKAPGARPVEVTAKQTILVDDALLAEDVV